MAWACRYGMAGFVVFTLSSCCWNLLLLNLWSVLDLDVSMDTWSFFSACLVSLWLHRLYIYSAVAFGISIWIITQFFSSKPQKKVPEHVRALSERSPKICVWKRVVTGERQPVVQWNVLLHCGHMWIVEHANCSSVCLMVIILSVGCVMFVGNWTLSLLWCSSRTQLNTCHLFLRECVSLVALSLQANHSASAQCFHISCDVNVKVGLVLGQEHD